MNTPSITAMTPERKSEIRNLTKPLIGGIANAREALGECLAEIDRLNAAARAGVVVRREDAVVLAAAETSTACTLEAHAAKLESHLQCGVSAAEVEKFRSDALNRAAVHRERAARIKAALEKTQ